MKRQRPATCIVHKSGLNDTGYPAEFDRESGEQKHGNKGGLHTRCDPLDACLGDIEIYPGHGQKPVKWKEATAQYMMKEFPDILKTTYKVPSVYMCSSPNVPCCFLGQSRKLFSSLRPERRGETAEQSVEDAFYKYGQESSRVMFIIRGFRYHTDYLGNLPKEIKESLPLEVKWDTNVKGEHDILLFMQQFGVAFIQIKNCEKLQRDNFGKACGQLKRDVVAFKQLNNALLQDENARYYRFIAVPNIRKNDLEKFEGICSSCKNSYFITKDDLNDLDFWFKSHTQNGREIAPEIYKLLVTRYASLCSSIRLGLRTANDAMTHALERINNELGTCENIMKVNEQWFRLNPEQMGVQFSDEKRLVIFGDWGTGKTLLLVKKCADFAKDRESLVFLISCADLTTGKKSFHMRQNKDTLLPERLRMLANVSEQNIEICSFSDIVRQVRDDIFQETERKGIAEISDPGDLLHMVRLFIENQEAKTRKTVHVGLDEFP